MWTKSCLFRCGCKALTEERLLGHGKFITKDEKKCHVEGVEVRCNMPQAKDKQYMDTVGKPETEFFHRLYPNMNTSKLAGGDCIPNPQLRAKLLEDRLCTKMGEEYYK